MPKTLAEVITEAQQDGADIATLVADLQALDTGTTKNLVSLTATYDDGSTVVCPVVS